MTKQITILLLSVLLFVSVKSSADSYPVRESKLPSAKVSTQSHTGSLNAGFTYPEITHTEGDIIYHEVVFYYTDDMLDYFNNDVELLLQFIENSIELNNTAFERQDIPLRREIAGVIRIPDDLDYDDTYTGIQRLNALKKLHNEDKYNFNLFYNVAYVVALNRYHTEVTSNTGSAWLGDKYSWVSPYRNQMVTRTLAHELGHNDGLTHDGEAADETHGQGTIRDTLIRYFAIGAFCDGYSSIMKNGQGDRSEAFFSSPLVTAANGEECGTEGEMDSARAYKEAIVFEIPNRTATFRNNRPSKAKTGHVSITTNTLNIKEGDTFRININWQDAELGDSVQLITRKSSADFNDITPKLRRVYFNGKDEVNSILINTLDDDDYELDEEFSVELLYGHGINIDDTMDKVSITVISDDIGNPGQVSFGATEVNLSEGETKSIKLQRDNGVDGILRIRVSLNTVNGLSDDLELSNTDITFDNGQTEASITISATDDQSVENSETVQLVLNAEEDAYLGQSSLNITIEDNDEPPQLKSDSAGGSMSFLWLMFGIVILKLKNHSFILSKQL
ncbi:hypothetical protein GCM10009128_26260 [Psychrosphaera haliotis]|uniref:Calx-beta domain-containing protein n=1 Tax=Psychrosphaera haliotis TaxID=555083 RepID=UPI0031E01C7F